MVSISMGSLDAAAGRGARIIASVSRGWGETHGHEMTLGATILGRPDRTHRSKGSPP